MPQTKPPGVDLLEIAERGDLFKFVFREDAIDYFRELWENGSTSFGLHGQVPKFGAAEILSVIEDRNWNKLPSRTVTFKVVSPFFDAELFSEVLGYSYLERVELLSR